MSKVLLNTNLALLLVWVLALTLTPEPATGQSDDELENEIPRLSTGSCKKSGMCCPGRDSSCVQQKAKPNAIIEDLDDIPCYCDHACLNIGDCCSDFKAACGGKYSKF
ncbi:Somatomedin-B and thrombospondin type-1 domain-containing protein [Orchesella cincta]|uniref:Somatomedin-B and thrombospondin type-1 domain-containing protein n=1 Tax=Orchesella cincta TaxID=48709 RepID=A0A1D2MSF4_ORCCI|nr:Somatomedin-B and thrombospondin type-1 domain-containing protein [Orchesella cincta]